MTSDRRALPPDELRRGLRTLTPGQRAELRSRLAGARAQAGPQPRGTSPAATEHPATVGQHAMWLAHLSDPHAATYHNAACLRIEGPLDLAALESALADVVRRHAPLRTVYSQHDERLVARVLDAPPLVHPIDLTAVPPSLTDHEWRRVARELAGRPFDLELEPPLRCHCMRLGERRFVLLLTFHHIASDGWSFAILQRELFYAYSARAAGHEPQLPPLDRSFADCARAERAFLESAGYRRSLEYWANRLKAATPLLDLPADRRRPLGLDTRAQRCHFELTAAQGEALHDVARCTGSTPFAVACASFVGLLARHVERSHICVGIPVDGRSDDGHAGLVGLFMNVAVLRVQVADDPSFEDLIRRTAHDLVELREHGAVPLSHVIERVAPQRDPSATPLYQVLFMMDNTPRAAVEFAGLRVRVEEIDLGRSPTDLTVSIRLHDGVSGFVDFRTDLFERPTVEALLGRWMTLLDAGFAEPGTGLGRLAISPAAEAATLSRWEQGPALPSVGSLAELLIEPLRIAPDTIAVVDGDGEHSRRALDVLSARVRDALLDRDLAAEARVALDAAGDLWTVAAFLGILRAGCVVVPLPAELPEARANSQVARAGCALWVVRAGDRPERGCPTLCPADLGTGEPAPPHRDRPGAEAYVMFTSGSTGRPKGVSVGVDGMLARIAALRIELPVSPGDRFLQTTSLGFDVSVMELLLPLACGGTLCLQRLPAGQPELWAPSLARWRINALFAVPSWLRRWVGLTQPDSLPDLRVVFAIGEALDRPLVQRLHATGPVLVVNGYGPTEGIIYQTLHLCRRDETGEPPIGRPAHGVTVRVLDAAGGAVPPLVEGELFVGGKYLANGYLDDPEQTSHRFVSDRRGPPGARLYATGDRASWGRDGTLRFHGRRDDQVQVSGFRVELAEVESAIAAQAGVLGVGVSVHETDGHTWLRAHVIGPDLDLSRLAGRLTEILPRYLVPSELVPCTDLPRNSSDKLDRRALAKRPVAGAADGYARPPISQWFRLPVWRPLVDAAPITHGVVLAVGVDPAAEPDLKRRIRCEHWLTAHVEDAGFAFGGESLIRPWTELAARVRDRTGGAAPQTVLFAAPGTDPATPDEQAIHAALRAAEAVTALSMALARDLSDSAVDIVVIGRDVFAVRPGDRPRAAGSLLVGPTSTVPVELGPALRCRLLDIDRDPGDAAEWIAGELGRPDPPATVALRDGRAWRRCHDELALPPQPESGARLPFRGTYLITGGAGGIGLYFADFLSRVCQARLVLVSRDAQRKAGHPDVGEALRLMAERGSEVHVRDADVAQPGALAAVLAELGITTLAGALHCAGVGRHTTVLRRTPDTTRAVLAPKVAGTLHLLAAVQPLNPGFVALFSSISSTVASPGGLDYTSSCAFQDAVATARATPGLVSIGWGVWRAVGAAAQWKLAGEFGERHQLHVQRGIQPAEGVQAFVRILNSGHSHVLVSPEPLSEFVLPWAEADATAAASAPPVAPSGGDPLAEILSIWRTALSRPDLGPDDDFFEAGGHSLMLVGLVNRLARRFGRPVSLARVFERPTPRGCLALFDLRHREQSPPSATIARARQRDRFPLSYEQEGLWFLHQLAPESAAYNMSGVLLLPSGTTVDDVRWALGAVVARHEALRTTFATADDQPIQTVAEHVEPPVTDLGVAADRESALAELANLAGLPFELAVGPLLRAGVGGAAGESLLGLTFHHIVCDDWSWDLIAAELAALLAARRDGGPVALPQPVLHPGDHARWQRAVVDDAVLAAAAAFWRAHLGADHGDDGAGPPVLDLPTSRPRPSVQTDAGAVYRFELPATTAHALTGYARAAGASHYMVLLAAWGCCSPAPPTPSTPSSVPTPRAATTSSWNPWWVSSSAPWRCASTSPATPTSTRWSPVSAPCC